MIIADTNVLLRAALDDDPRQTEIAQQCLFEAKVIVVPLHAACEFVWVLSRSYRLGYQQIAASLEALVGDVRVSCDREAIDAGLAFLRAGGDFADGVIEHEGRRLGGEVFLTFDQRAAAIVRAAGRKSLILKAR